MTLTDCVREFLTDFLLYPSNVCVHISGEDYVGFFGWGIVVSLIVLGGWGLYLLCKCRRREPFFVFQSFAFLPLLFGLAGSWIELLKLRTITEMVWPRRGNPTPIDIDPTAVPVLLRSSLYPAYGGATVSFLLVLVALVGIFLLSKPKTTRGLQEN